ncbi:MAG: hypothetical protein K2G69_01280 [Muribaculaceae bacterium]|nr:hypothetical protein [Muribaculaceae bacterium]
MEKEQIIAFFKGIDYSDIWIQGLIGGIVLGIFGCFFLRKLLTRVQKAKLNGVYLRKWNNTNNSAREFWRNLDKGQIQLSMTDRKDMMSIRLRSQVKILLYALIILGMGIFTCMWIVAVIMEG